MNEKDSQSSLSFFLVFKVDEWNSNSESIFSDECTKQEKKIQKNMNSYSHILISNSRNSITSYLFLYLKLEYTADLTNFMIHVI